MPSLLKHKLEITQAQVPKKTRREFSEISSLQSTWFNFFLVSDLKSSSFRDKDSLIGESDNETILTSSVSLSSSSRLIKDSLVSTFLFLLFFLSEALLLSRLIVLKEVEGFNAFSGDVEE